MTPEEEEKRERETGAEEVRKDKELTLRLFSGQESARCGGVVASLSSTLLLSLHAHAVARRGGGNFPSRKGNFLLLPDQHTQDDWHLKKKELLSLPRPWAITDEPPAR